MTTTAAIADVRLIMPQARRLPFSHLISASPLGVNKTLYQLS